VNSRRRRAASSIAPRILPAVPIMFFKNATDATDVDAGTVLLHEGETGDAMLVVIDGTVDVMVSGSVVETVGPGGIVGELALIDDAPRSAEVIASSPARVLRVDKQRFTFLVQEHPTFALQVMEQMAARLRRANVAGASATGS
jgi:CRP-like cAMP-binding protein